MPRVRNALRCLILLMAVVYIGVTAWLAVFADAPMLKRITFGFLVLFVTEKIWVMNFVIRPRFLPSIGADWSMLATGAAYTTILYVSLIGLWRASTLTGYFAFVGVVVALTAVALRYWALAHLRQGATEKGVAVLQTNGPFGLVRHPIYLAACAEVVALAMICHAPTAFVLAVAVYIPVQIHRIVLEEKALRAQFREAYDAYASHVPMIVPAPKQWPRRPRSGSAL